jgi:hypothetical protein
VRSKDEATAMFLNWRFSLLQQGISPSVAPIWRAEGVYW